MDELKNKKYMSFNYVSRYTGVPYYYNVKDDREVAGLSKNLLKDTS